MHLRTNWNRMCIFLICALLAVGVTIWMADPASAQDSQSEAGTEGNYPVVIYFFWGEGCPHCAQAEPFLQSLVDSNPHVQLKSYEVLYNAENQTLWAKMATAYHFEPTGVPTIFIGESYWVGYSDTIAKEIENKVAECLKSGCPDPGAGIIPGESTSEATPQPTSTPIPGNPQENNNIINIPIFGKVDLNKQSMLVSTLVISFVDGFNPCSLWVLSMLLALTLHTGSRKKIFIIGMVFILVTALVYVLFITGLFTLFNYVSFMRWIQVVVALIALFFGLVNIKDYFFYKEGLSFTIPDDKKTGILQKMRRVLDASQSLWGLIGATIVLAGGVSLVEFSCTAGFPVIWTNLLSANHVQTPQFILLLMIYMVIYQLDELAIFLTAVFTLKSSRLEEKSGRILKLIGGTLMLTLALVMIIDPTKMNSIGTTLAIFGIAFAAALLVLIFHRKVLPKFGIWVGTEASPKKKHQKKNPRH